MRRFRALVLTCALPLCAACDDGSTTEVSAVVDVAGTWLWSEYTIIDATPAAVALFGIAQEGSVTRLDCHSWGSLTLAQDGTSFAGSATQRSSCSTPGGQTFDPAPIFPSSFRLDGQLEQEDVRFTVDTGGFPCHYQGEVLQVGGAVTELRASGGCEVPPEFGTDRIVGWTAVRM